MSLLKIKNGYRRGGFVGEITSAANPTFGRNLGEFSGTNSVRFKVPQGMWELHAQFEGVEQFQLTDGVTGSVLIQDTLEMNRIIEAKQDMDCYFVVRNWSTQVGKKMFVCLTEIPLSLSLSLS